VHSGVAAVSKPSRKSWRELFVDEEPHSAAGGRTGWSD
jgi:hypothetical protein